MSNSKEIEKIRTIYGSFYSRKDDFITRHLKKYSAHTRNELAMIKSLVRDGDNIIDIGAHIGYFTIYAAKNAYQGIVYSIEPYIESFEILKKNLKLNDLSNVKPFHAAISKITGHPFIPCNRPSILAVEYK